MTNDQAFRRTLQGAHRSLSPPGGVAAVGPTPLQQVIEVLLDLGCENLRLIDEVRKLRKWLQPSVVASAVLAGAFLIGAYTMWDLANEQRLTREQSVAEAKERMVARKRESEAIQATANRAESAAKAAQVAAQAAAAEGLAAQADAIAIQVQIAPPSRRKAVRAQLKRKRAEAEAARH